MIQEPVPGEMKELLESQQLNGVPVLLSTTSDLSLKGDLHGHWIVVTRDHLAVVADGVEPRLVNHVPISRVEKFRTQGAIGSGFLQAYVEEAWIDVARYSNTLAPRFHLLADKLEDLRTERRGDRSSRGRARQDPLPEMRHATGHLPASRARGACRGRQSLRGSGSFAATMANRAGHVSA